ncbi:hypothetical protein IFM89_011781 [Coptis chinensis]|uniref:Phorbol-ester/DAG-type domain-containing protein n=1 Tax=Coptis chinensis TaxID=261450 RepID=A0A835M5H2_9MAGN|nr:hypothetical protein IFM89_011781 [Coptis chinensis]
MIELGFSLFRVLTSDGLFGISAVIYAILKSLRKTILSWIKAAALTKETQAGTPHLLRQWSERSIKVDENTEMSAFCNCCDELYDTPFLDTSTWHCLWCQRLVHVKCHKKLVIFVTLSSHRRLVLSALSVKETDKGTTAGGVLSSIKEEIIDSSVCGQIRRRNRN